MANLTTNITAWNPTTAAQSTTVSVTSNTSWTVTSNATWLTRSLASGSNNQSFTMSVTANTGAARTGTVTVTGGGITRTITVTQAGATSSAIILPFNASTTINITSGGRRVVRFTAPHNATFKFTTPTRSASNIDPVGFSASSGSTFVHGGGLGTGTSFTFTVAMTTGQTFTFFAGVRNDSNVTGSYTLLVTNSTDTGFTVRNSNGTSLRTFNNALEAVNSSSQEVGTTVWDNGRGATIYARNNNSQPTLYMFSQNEPLMRGQSSENSATEDDVRWYMKNHSHFMHVFRSDGRIFGNGAYEYRGSSTQLSVDPGRDKQPFNLGNNEPVHSHVYKYSNTGFRRMTASIPMGSINAKITKIGNDQVNNAYIYCQLVDTSGQWEWPNNYVEIGIQLCVGSGWRVFTKKASDRDSVNPYPWGTVEVGGRYDETTGIFTTNSDTLNLQWRIHGNNFEMLIDNNVRGTLPLDGLTSSNARFMAATTFVHNVVGQNTPNYNNGNYMTNVIWQNTKLHRNDNNELNSIDFRFNGDSSPRTIVHNDHLIRMTRSGNNETVGISWTPKYGSRSQT